MINTKTFLETELEKLGANEWTIFDICNKVKLEQEEYGKKEYYRGHKNGKQDGMQTVKDGLESFLKNCGKP